MFAEIELKNTEETAESVEMTANAATVIRYKMVFGKDLQKDLTPVLQGLNSRNADEDSEKLGALGDIDTEIISKLAYIMHKQALNEINRANIEDYISWLEKFSSTAFLEGAGDILSLYFGQKVGTSNPKKSTAPQIES